MMTEGGARVGVVLLAAGRGTRFTDGPKLLAPWRGAPLVRHAAQAALGSALRPVVAVTGHAAEAVRGALAGLALTLVENLAYAQGLSTSLKAGLAALPAEVAAAVVLLGDMPQVSSALLDRLAEAYRAAPDAAAVVPVSGGRRGNPVLLDRRRLAAELAGLGGDHGAGPLLRGRADVHEIAVDDESVLADVDTAAALASLAD